MNGNLTAVYQFCYLRGSLGILKRVWFLAAVVFPNAYGCRDSPRSTLRNTWLSFLLILEERYSQSCTSSCAGKPFRGRPLCTHSHYGYTSHIHSPTQSTADTSTKAPTHTHFHKDVQTYSTPHRFMHVHGGDGTEHEHLMSSPFNQYWK